eukprot:15234594-Alexandrium_andersonii.AAC.1
MILWGHPIAASTDASKARSIWSKHLKMSTLKAERFSSASSASSTSSARRQEASIAERPRTPPKADAPTHESTHPESERRRMAPHLL